MPTVSDIRRAKYESLLPKVMEAARGPARWARAFVFRKSVGHLNGENHFEAAFADAQYARDFVSCMESMEYTWTVVEVYWDGDRPCLGTLVEFNGGLPVSRTLPPGRNDPQNYPQAGERDRNFSVA